MNSNDLSYLLSLLAVIVSFIATILSFFTYRNIRKYALLQEQRHAQNHNETETDQL